METRDFPLRIKMVNEGAGTFTGFASTYTEQPDLQGDVVARGAFAQAIKSQGPGYPLLLAHKQDCVLGICKIEDADDGLLCHGKIDIEDQFANNVFSKVKMHALRGLSVGFLPGLGKVQYTGSGRILKEVRLFEISLTPTPANPGAQVFSVKSISDARLLLQRLKTDDVEAGTIEELKAIEAQLRRLLPVDPGPTVDPAILSDLKGLAQAMRA